MQDNEPILSFQNVCFQYKEEDFDIVDNLSFDIQAGEFVSLIGPSGCGKSTIFKLTSRLLSRKSGSILLHGTDISRSGKVGAGYMPQKDLLFPWRTIRQNLCLPMEIAKVPKEEQTRRADAMLEEVGLRGWADKYPKDLSGGMRQRVSFARTLLTDAPLLLLDEPFSALDALTRMTMQEWLIRQWQHFDKTILFITHDVEEALFMSQKILLVEQTPIDHLKEVRVPMEYPRRRDFMMRPQIVQLKEDLIESLRKQVKF